MRASLGALPSLAAAVLVASPLIAVEPTARDFPGSGVARPRIAGRASDLKAIPSLAEPARDWLAAAGVAMTRESAVVNAGSAAFVTGELPIADFPDAVTDAEQLDAASIAYNPARGEYLVAWQAFVRETATNIYGRLVSATGSPIGSTFTICDAPGVQAVPSVSFEASTGTYWVAWSDFRSGGAPDIVMRRVSSSGSLLGAEIVPNTGDNEAFAGRIACGDGRCVVVWENAPGDGNSHILIRSYDPAGTPLTTVLLLSEPVGAAAEPDICHNPEDGQFLVVWYESNGSDWDVWSFALTDDLWAVGRRAVTQAPGHQVYPRVAYSAASDRYLVVWQDGRSMATWDIYGQLLARDGSAVGSPLPIYLGAYHDTRPDVAGSGSSGEFAVAFQRDISGAEQYEIYGARVSSGGSIGSAFAIRLWYNIRWTPAIVHRSGSTEYLAGWTDFGAATQTDIQAQRFLSDGTLMSDLITVSRGRKGQEAPAAAYGSARNEYLAVWADYRTGDDYDLYGRRVSADGTLLGQEILIGSTSFLYGDPAVTYDPTVDEYFVVWQEVTSPQSGYEIYGRRLGGGGDPRGAAVLVSRDTGATNEGLPDVVFNSQSREYLVLWHAFTTGAWHIWGQRISEAGQLIGSNFTVSVDPANAQSPRAAFNAAHNEYLAAWLDLRDGRVDVYAQRLSGTGARIGGELAVSTVDGNKGRCDVAYGSVTDDYLVVWGDTRSGGADIYGQRITASGTLSAGDFAIAATPASELAPAIAYDPATAQYLTAWWEFHETTDYDLYARVVPATGPPVDAIFPVSTALEVQRRVELVRNATAGRQLIVWQDFRNASYDVYGRIWSAGPVPRVRRFVGHR